MQGNNLSEFDARSGSIVDTASLESPAMLAAFDARQRVAYLLDTASRLLKVTSTPQGITVAVAAPEFGPADRGLLVLPVTGRVVALGEDGAVTVYDPAMSKVHRASGPVPEPAGPATDPTDDAWYFAGEHAVRYRLELQPGN
jgi:hypothetical protein